MWTNIICVQQLPHILLGEGLEWTAMHLAHSWRDLINDLVAAPRLVISLLSLLTEHMSDIIGIVLFKLLSIHACLLCEFLLPEYDGLVQSKP